MEKIKIKIINQLQDNYSYILQLKDFPYVTIIDPAESKPHLEYLKKNNLSIENIFLTHHHHDHTAGVSDLIANYPKVKVYSPSFSIQKTTDKIKNDTIINTNINRFQIIDTPGHTLDHIILHDLENNLLFCGDTLFRLGCGRVFEGSLKQMHNSLNKINNLPDRTKVFCGHEYTKNNLIFLENISNKSKHLLTVSKQINYEMTNTGRTVPFYLGDEKKFNPFLNQDSNFANSLKSHNILSNEELFIFLREKKDNF